MRSVPLLGEKVWFGPRRFGWGLSPVSVEGWVVTGVALLLSFVLGRRFPNRPLARHLPALALAAIAIAKGTAPGGPRARSGLRTAAVAATDD